MKEFFEFMDLLNKYSSLILMFATLIYVYFTYRLTRETTKLRELETTPLMSAYIQSSTPLKIIIKNIGKAPAYNIKFSIAEKYKPLFACGCSLDHEMSYFSADQELIFPIKSYDDVDQTDFENIPLEVQYCSKDTRSFSDKFSLEWRYLSGTKVDEDNLATINSSIKDLAKELKSISETIKEKTDQKG